MNPRLAQLAESNLAKLSLTNVQVKTGDASKSLDTEEPFDAIILCGSIAQPPEHLLGRLLKGGRLLGIFGNEPIMRATKVTKVEAQQFNSQVLWDCYAPRLHGFVEDSKFNF
jgi:protein-L-isoaspartate(D-aspartate) O-methyltransferase